MSAGGDAAGPDAGPQVGVPRPEAGPAGDGSRGRAGRGSPLDIPPHHDPACWGCGSAPDGIRLPAPGRAGGTEYAAPVRFDERHQGGPGIVHGGLVAAALDEACGLLATWYRFPSVTVRLDVRFRRPAPINTPLALRAWLRKDAGRRIHVDGDLRNGDELLAEARAAFAHVPLEHFLATPEGRAAGERWRRRLGAP